MTDFDPDAYLTQESHFDPDAYLSATPVQTAKAPENTWGGALKGDIDIAASVASHAIVDPLAAAARTVNRVIPEAIGGPGSKATAEQDINALQHQLTYDPSTPEGQYGLAQLGKMVSPVTHGLSAGTAALIGRENVPAAADVVTSLPLFGEAKLLQSATQGSKAYQESLRAANAERDAALLAGRKEGYVVPPATTNPTLANRAIEGVAGKINLQQASSIKNQQITNSLARRALDLPPDAPLNSETMGLLRNQAGQTYEAVKNSGTMTITPDYGKELSRITSAADRINADLPGYKSGASQQIADLVSSLKPPSGQMDTATAVELSKDLRFNANSNHLAASRSGDPTLRALARAQSQAAEVVENEVERHLTSQGKKDLAGSWDDARRTIAKTYSVENALDGAGNVDAGKLAKQSLKGKPLSPELQTAADFANAFPKATKVGASKESMPGISPLDVFAGTGIGETAHAAGASPAAAIATGIGVPAARITARSLATSPLGQRMAVPSYLGKLSDLVNKP